MQTLLDGKDLWAEKVDTLNCSDNHTQNGDTVRSSLNFYTLF